MTPSCGPQLTYLKNMHFRPRAGLAANNEHENIVVHFNRIVAGECCGLLDKRRWEAFNYILKVKIVHVMKLNLLCFPLTFVS